MDVEVDVGEWRLREEPLWRADTRYDAAYMDAVLHPDFTEFGRSGRTYDRAAILADPQAEIRATLPLAQFRVEPLTPDVVLVHYVSEVQYDELEVANRTSVWVRVDAEWRLRFHQGTPTSR